MKKHLTLAVPFAFAALFCLANAWKPATIDDPAYLRLIPAILDDPTRPYGPPPDGFRLVWYKEVQGAFTLLAPIVVPYWLALGASLIGADIVALKLWLFPFCLLFTFSLWELLYRFAPGYAILLLAATLCSPTFLPSLNIMIDIPALALGLAAICIFMRGLEARRGRWALVICSGLLAGLAAQTKYTGITAIAAIVLYGLTHRGWRPALAAAALAVAVFVAWEVYLAEIYGRSHFLLHARQRRLAVTSDDPVVLRLASEALATVASKSELLAPTIGTLGGLTPTLSLLFLAGLRCRRAVIWAMAGLLYGGFALMLLVPDRWAVFYRDPQRPHIEYSLSTIAMGISGTVFLVLLATATASLGISGWSTGRLRPRHDRTNWFLIGWLAIEMGACLFLSPFAAVRRVMGIVVVSTLLAGRLLAQTPRTAAGQQLERAIVVSGLALGLLFAWTDYRDACLDQSAALESIDWVRRQAEGDRPIWYSGHWGFAYYAGAAGARPIEPGTTILTEGDWVLFPDSRLRPYGSLIRLDPDEVAPAGCLEWQSSWPLRTVPDYYDGYQPIRRHEGQRLRVAIFRVKRKFLAQPS